AAGLLSHLPRPAGLRSSRSRTKAALNDRKVRSATARPLRVAGRPRGGLERTGPRATLVERAFSLLRGSPPQTVAAVQQPCPIVRNATVINGWLCPLRVS